MTAIGQPRQSFSLHVALVVRILIPAISQPSLLLFFNLTAFALPTSDSLYQHPPNDAGAPKATESDSQLVQDLLLFKEASLSPSNSTRLSLEDCIRYAFLRNPKLQAAVFSVRESGLNFVAARNTWYPTITFSSDSFPSYNYSYQYSRDDRYTKILASNSTPAIRTGGQNTDYSFLGRSSFESSLTWNFLDPTRQPYINSTSSQYQASKYVLVSTLRQVASDIQSLYISLQAQRELIDSYSLVLESLLENLDIVKARHQAGLVSVLDVEQSYSQLYNTTTLLSASIRTYNDISSRLSAIVSSPQRRTIIPTEALEVEPDWKLSLKDSIDYALAHNDTILQTLSLASSSRWQGLSFLNQSLPKLSLGIAGSYSPSDLKSTTRSNSYDQSSSVRRSNESIQWSEKTNLAAFLGLSWTLFQGGVNTSQAASKFAQAEAYLEQSKNQKNQLAADIRSRYLSLTANKLAIRSSQKQLKAALESYRAASARFAIGMENVTTIVQSVQLYQAALRERTTSIQEYNTSLATLYKDTAIWPPVAEETAEKFLSSSKY